jgi:NAD(P)-dependent dehydrogenase (short-subunit alcohol dehydrogenase family)
MPHLLAHGFVGGHALDHAAAFGTDWWSVAVPVLVLLAAGVALIGAGRTGVGVLGRLGAGASRVTGLPAWCAATLALVVAGLIIAVLGFFWDVAWHIDIGRDEFLFSPPHICLLVGLSLLTFAGLAGIRLATRDGADVGWRIGPLQIPYGAAALVIGGTAALAGFGVDELWHRAYGLDVTMWSPPHLIMISTGAFSGIAAWITYAEAGPFAANRVTRWFLGGLLAGVALIAMSVWQLEYDLGVPQWQAAAQPILIAIGGAFALTAARAAVGRGGALIAVTHFLAVRTALLVVSVLIWDVSQPRFPFYVAAAGAVELAFHVTRKARPIVTFLAAGAGVGTLGLAGEWLVTHLWLPHPWQPGLLPEMVVAAAAAVAAAVLGGAFGRAVSHRPTGLNPRAGVLAMLVLLVTVIVPLPRQIPAATATVATTPAGEGASIVTVTVDPPSTVIGADRWEVMAWQGGGRVSAALQPVGDGSWRTTEPVPTSGDWKTLVVLAKGSHLGGVHVVLPADPAVGAAAVPLSASKTVPFVDVQELYLREAHEGPAWPGIVAYVIVGLSLVAIIGSLAAGAVGLQRQRRLRGWRRGPGSLAGARVLLTGAAGGIGSAARRALEAQGARVVGLDLVADGPDTLAVDLTDPHAVAVAVTSAVARLGGLDVVVANAGIGVAADSTSPPDDVTRRVVDVNLFGAWSTIAAALPHLRDGGRIVAVTSGLATATVPFAAAYVASKRGLAGYLDVLRAECDGRWSVSEVQPGYMTTAIHAQSATVNAGLAGIVRAEPVGGAAAAIVAACESGRPRLASSALTAVELFFARHLPSVTSAVIGRRTRRAFASRGRPEFSAPKAPPVVGGEPTARSGLAKVPAATPTSTRR